MVRILLVAAAVLVVSACNKTPENNAAAHPEVSEQSATPKQDVSDEALIAIDPEIKRFVDVCANAKSEYDANTNDKNRTALINAYIAFGDYMTYESPVSPRKGKYHRALIEYRHALTLDPKNEKAQQEIKQIEDIYRSMGRPIPEEV